MAKQKRRLYSIFEKRGKRWHRLSEHAFYMPTAAHVFQDRLLAPYLGYEKALGPRELRPVPREH